MAVSAAPVLLLLAVAAAALVPMAHAQAPDFIAFDKKDLGPGFDLKSADGKLPYLKVGGGRKAVEAACKGNKACDAFTFGGEGEFGYLKTAGGKPARFADKAALVASTKGWSTFIRATSLPKSMGGTAPDAPAGGARPSFCLTPSGPICCYTWGSKYNTCNPMEVKAPEYFDPANWGGKSWSQVLEESCKVDKSRPWDQPYKSKVECCKERNGETGCSMGPSARSCWLPAGGGKCKLTELGKCNLKYVMGYYSQEECEAAP